MSERNWSPEVARALHEFGEAAPLPPSTDALRDRTLPRARPRRAVSVAAAALVLAGAAGTWAVLGRSDTTPAGGGAIEVHHAIYEVSITGTLECPTPIDTTGTFDTAIVETWADRTGRQWRSQITYPDGSTYDSIYQGSAIYPTAAFERGTLKDRRLGCTDEVGDVHTLVASTGAFFTLTIRDELTPDEWPYVSTIEEWGTLVDAGVVDSRGRTTDTWEQRISGFYGDGSDAPITQVATWWIAADGTITQHSFTDTTATIGTATTTESLVSDETITVDSEVFSTDGYTALGGTERPDMSGPDGVPESTVTAAASPFDSGASMIVYVRPGANPDQIELLRSEIERNAPLGDDGLVYLDTPAALAEVQRIFADRPADLALFNATNVPTMFLLFPTEELAPELAQAFRELPNVVDVATPTSLDTEEIPLTPPTDTTPTIDPSNDCPGEDLDLASEPPLWRQYATGSTWYRAGCVVRIDVITDNPGADHCGWGTSRYIAIGSPLGTPFTSPADDVQYVRDPANVYGYGFDATFDAQATLPADAVYSGYSTDDEQLWTVPGDDSFIYLVLSDRTERWPKGDPPVCS